MTIVSPWMVRPPNFADATSSTGLSRTVTVELLLIQSSRFVGGSPRAPADANRLMLRKNKGMPQPCYTPSPSDAPAPATRSQRETSRFPMGVPPSSPVLLDATDVSFAYARGERTIIDGVSLSVRRGAILGLLGPNGDRKSVV